MAQSQAARPSEGLFARPRRMEAIADLFANVWQLGYVTTDLDRAVEFMADRFGLEHCVKLPTGGAVFGKKADEPRRTISKIDLHAIDIVRGERERAGGVRRAERSVRTTEGALL